MIYSCAVLGDKCQVPFKMECNETSLTADDICLFAHTQADMQSKLGRLEKYSSQAGLKINIGVHSAAFYNYSLDTLGT